MNKEVYDRTKNDNNEMRNWIKPVKYLSQYLKNDRMNRLRMPYTQLVPIKYGIEKTLYSELGMPDDKQTSETIMFVKKLKEACRKVSNKSKNKNVFIKTGSLAMKWYWSETCCVDTSDIKKVEENVRNLIEHNLMSGRGSYTVDIAVREMIPTRCYFEYDGRGMPVTPEVRCVVINGELSKIHPYWPEFSIKEITEENNEKLKAMNILIESRFNEFKKHALEVYKDLSHLHKGWTIDFLLDKCQKIWLIDVGEYEKSFIWEDYKLDSLDEKLMEYEEVMDSDEYGYRNPYDVDKELNGLLSDKMFLGVDYEEAKEENWDAIRNYEERIGEICTYFWEC